MPKYTIEISDLAEKALAYKAAVGKKTKGEIFNDYVVDGLLASWIREMLDAEVSPLKKKWDSLTQTQKDQINAIVG